MKEAMICEQHKVLESIEAPLNLDMEAKPFLYIYIVIYVI